MTNIRTPKYSGDDMGRSRECEAACNMAITEVVRRAVAAGWQQARSAD